MNVSDCQKQLVGMHSVLKMQIQASNWEKSNLAGMRGPENLHFSEPLPSPAGDSEGPSLGQMTDHFSSSAFCLEQDLQMFSVKEQTGKILGSGLCSLFPLLHAALAVKVATDNM